MAFGFPSANSRGTTTVTTSGTPVPLVSTAGTNFGASISIVPLKTNAGKAYAGFGSGSGQQHVVLPWTISAVDGKKFDLNTIYVDVANSGEGVAWEAIN